MNSNQALAEALRDIADLRAHLAAAEKALRFVHEKLAPSVEVDWAVPHDVACAVVDEVREVRAAAEKERDENAAARDLYRKGFEDQTGIRKHFESQVAALKADRKARDLRVVEAAWNKGHSCGFEGINLSDPGGAGEAIRARDIAALLEGIE